jgi:1-deoxy-D-xylulose-5-phosphate synthase
MVLLDGIRGPADLRGLSLGELSVLAGEVREFLVGVVSRTGGHLGPNLGVVELSIGLHRVFQSPRDRILWDTGHQAYVHKLLTGRMGGFDRLRQRGGLSGYPSRAESEHDVIENSHASTALSYADGLARAYALTGQRDRAVVAVVGDGALTGGMAWEAVNNIAAADRPVIIVVNDNGRSYAPTVGGIADWLSGLRTAAPYERFLEWGKNTVRATPVLGPPVYDLVHAVKAGVKDLVAPQALFTGMGLKYLGPVDGHDLAAVEAALTRARRFAGPVLVHCVTEKGRGWAPAESDVQDKMHVYRATTPATGDRTPSTAVPTWTEVFGAELAVLAAERPEVVAITAAMLEPTGLETMAAKFPDRVFDVGIAEQHAVTCAAGLAMGGLHPVVCLYATFLNRAFDQLLMDVALHQCGVTFVLDRAGVTGDDGPSHNGMWDLSLLQIVPGLRIAAPRDAATLRRTLREAVDVSDGPTVVRFPKGVANPDLPAVSHIDGMDILRTGVSQDVLLICVGALASLGVQVADELAATGLGVTVVDPCWVRPVNPALTALARRHQIVVTLEDSGRVGGVGAAIAQHVCDAGVPTPVHTIGLPQRFLDHGKRVQVLAECGLTVPDITTRIKNLYPTPPDTETPPQTEAGTQAAPKTDATTATSGGAGVGRRPR